MAEFKFLRNNIFENDVPQEPKPKRKKSDQKAEADQEKADAEKKVLKAIADKFAQTAGYSSAYSDRDKKTGTTLRIKDNNSKSTFLITAIMEKGFESNGAREAIVTVNLEDGDCNMSVNANSKRELNNVANAFASKIMTSAKQTQEAGDASAVANKLKSQGFGQKVQFADGHKTESYWGEVYIDDPSTFRLVLRNSHGVAGGSLGIKATTDLNGDVEYCWKYWAKICDDAIRAKLLKDEGQKALKKLGKKPSVVEVKESIPGTYRHDAIKYLERYAEEKKLHVTWKSGDSLWQATVPLFRAILGNEDGEVVVQWIHPDPGSVSRPITKIISVRHWTWIDNDAKWHKGLPLGREVAELGAKPNTMPRKEIDVPDWDEDLTQHIADAKKEKDKKD